MKRSRSAVVLMLALMLCGCAQNQAERRSTVGRILLAPVVLGLWCLSDTDDGPSTDEILENQSKIHTDGMVDP